MNTPKKFRVWLPSLNKFGDDNSVFMDCYGKLYGVTRPSLVDDSRSIVNIGQFKEFDGYTIQWYTGLNDSEGNEIYEGDIVINTTSDEEYCSPAVIIWGKYEFVGFALAYKCNKLEDYHAPLIHKINGVDLVEEFSLSKMGTYQIVGNASENPELLK